MNKLDMKTNNLTEENIKKITKLFPNVIKEGVIDFDLLKQELSDVLVEGGEERYRLDWPGKRESILKANTSINKTLRPVVKDSVDFENTENLYIEGDNFEVLKLLQESYLNKVKMIYIDPPYNTGKDFVYKDNFKQDKEEYDKEVGAIDEEDNKLFKNTDTNGRFHSDWLSMMYERLTVARDLLKDDGVVFVSIDDNEIHNLRKICDEIFGGGNFFSQLSWKNRTKPKNMGEARFNIQQNTEYILVYGKKSMTEYPRFILEFLEEKKYPLSDEEGNYRIESLDQRRNIGLLKRDKMVYAISDISPKNGFRWQLSYEKYIQLNNKKRIVIKNRKPSIKIYNFEEDNLSYKPFWSYLENTGTAEDGKKELNKIFGHEHGFETVKPLNLIKKIIKYTVKKDKNSIVFDFFSGSATTAHAVMQLNAEDGGNRKFIMVQLPEETDKKSEAYKAGYKTISDIGKERIRRASKKIKEELKEKDRQLKMGEETINPEKLDFGFRVYKTDSSNMKDVYYNPKDLNQDLLSGLANNIKEDRSPEDLLTQIILDLGLELSLRIEEKDILGNKVFLVAENSLVACFDEKINIKIVDEIAKIKPLKVVFCDAGFKDDKDRINVEERFKRLSPETRVNVI